MVYAIHFQNIMIYNLNKYKLFTEFTLKKISFHDSDKTKRIGLITISEFKMVIDFK